MMGASLPFQNDLLPLVPRLDRLLTALCLIPSGSIKLSATCNVPSPAQHSMPLPFVRGPYGAQPFLPIIALNIAAAALLPGILSRAVKRLAREMSVMMPLVTASLWMLKIIWRLNAWGYLTDLCLFVCFMILNSEQGETNFPCWSQFPSLVCCAEQSVEVRMGFLRKGGAHLQCLLLKWWK